MRHLALLVPLVLGCATSDDPPDLQDPDEAEDTEDSPPEERVLPSYPEQLAGVDLLVRASLDLRGVRPTPAELEAVEADPDSVDALIDAFPDDSRFAGRIEQLFQQVYQTRVERPFALLDYYLETFSLSELARSIGFEPVKVLGHIASEDLPYTELVTGDWTMANEILGEMWPVDYPDGETGWRRVHYTDGRPEVGVLVSNGLWWHYGSMENNLNRGRANAVSRIFLCADYLEVEIDFGSDQPLNSEEALGNAIRTDPACAGCHDTLDPLASHFFGYWWFGSRKGLPHDISTYHPDRELEWMSYDGLPPALNGEQTGGLGGLGPRIAEDPRFARCFVEQSWELLMRRQMTREESVWIDEHEEDFREGDLRVDALWRALVASPAYRDAGDAHGRKLLSASLLSSVVADLTGYRVEEDGYDLLLAPFQGFLPLAGGVDGLQRAVPLVEPGATLALVHQRLSEAAAIHVARHDRLTRTEPPRLLDRIDWTESATQGEERVRDQLVRLHARILSERVFSDDPRVDEEVELWRAVLADTRNPEAAWASVITLLLRDPSFLVY